MEAEAAADSCYIGAMTATHPHLSRLFEQVRLGGLSLRNRTIKAATYEGMTPGGMPSAALVEHHRRIAAGDIGMTTVAYCSVSPDGRTFPAQLTLAPRSSLGCANGPPPSTPRHSGLAAARSLRLLQQEHRSQRRAPPWPVAAIQRLRLLQGHGLVKGHERRRSRSGRRRAATPGDIVGSDCDHCNECIAEMDAGGVRCVRPEAPGHARLPLDDAP